MSQRNSTLLPHLVEVIDVVPGPARKIWRVALVEEHGSQLLEIRLCNRHPDGSASPTTHRVVLQAGTYGRIGRALLNAEGRQ